MAKSDDVQQDQPVRKSRAQKQPTNKGEKQDDGRIIFPDGSVSIPRTDVAEEEVPEAPDRQGA
jgi:hypothetical protein